MSLLVKIKRYGFIGSVGKVSNILKRKGNFFYWRLIYRDAPVYVNPTSIELEAIERDLVKLGVSIHSYTPPHEFKEFQKQNWFPTDYHGGLKSGVWDEKLLEHWISSETLELMNFNESDIYVDVAAASSPWAKVLRERRGLSAFAIDLEEKEAFCHLPYYRVENATKTTFSDACVRGMSLHCAYEMFMGQDDTLFISEAARILKPGGKVVILPLYTHTHYCSYATPDYFDKGYSDPAAKEYIRWDCRGIPSSRKYDAVMLKRRVLDHIESLGMQYKLFALRNKAALGNNIYCHFILEITR